MEKTESIFRAFDENPPITLRANPLKTTAEALGDAMKQKNIGYQPTKYVPGGIRLRGHCPIEEIPGFSDGDCFVQDEASQIAAYVLGAQPGEFIIDACSCPGGKSFSTALWMKNEGKILSCDLHKNKLSLVSNGAKRLGIDIIGVREQNGKEYCSELDSSFDRVLCDVPCSGLGGISKKPDLRYREKSEDLAPLGLEILNKSANYVKPGGVLLYSPRTLAPEENEENVRLKRMLNLALNELNNCKGFFGTIHNFV